MHLLPNNAVNPPSQFDPVLWQNSYTTLMEPVLLTLHNLSNNYRQCSRLFETGPSQKKSLYYAKMKTIEKQILAIEEGYKAGLDYVAAMCTGFYVEFKRMEVAKNKEIDDMHQAYELASEVAIEALKELQRLKSGVQEDGRME